MKQKQKHWFKTLAIVVALLVMFTASVAFGADIQEPETEAPADIPAETPQLPETGSTTPGDTQEEAEAEEQAPQEPSDGDSAIEEEPAPEESEGPVEGNGEEALETESEVPLPLQYEEEDEEEPQAPPEEAVDALDAGYAVLEDGVSAVVTDFAQLKEATEGDNGIANVYLGADVTLEKNRTVIHSSKAAFRLSGRNPLTGERFTITEFNTTGLANIVVANGNGTTKTVVMEDMTIVNRGDYYGLIGVEDGVAGVDMIVRNVSFSGRQFAYNLYGRLIFEGNNDITIAQAVGGVAGQEVAEVPNIIVRGSLNIDFQSAYHVFRMNSAASRFTVEGSLTINAPRVAAGYGIIQSLEGGNAVDIAVSPGARVSITANTRLASGIINNLTVGAGASFYYEKTGSDSTAAIGLRQKLTVGSGANFTLKSGAGYPIRFYDVPASMAGGVMRFDSPNKVVLLNSANTAMVYGTKNEEFSVTTQYLKYWNRGQDPTADEPAFCFTRWDIADNEDISIDMVHRAGVPSAVSTNHAGITASTLRLDANARQIVFGQEPKATLRFSARHEETGEPIGDFQMEDMVVDMGKETQIQPPGILGYIATGYSVDGGGVRQLEDGIAAITPTNDVVDVVFYYNEPVMEISVPVKMMFAAYENDGGTVTSQTYSFANNSSFAVDVSLSGVAGMENADELELAEQDEGQLWLYLQPEDSGQFNTVDIVDPDGGSAYIGQLTPKGEAQGQSMDFTLAGQYYGAFGAEAKWPGYNVEFTFGMSGKGDTI